MFRSLKVLLLFHLFLLNLESLHAEISVYYLGTEKRGASEIGRVKREN